MIISKCSDCISKMSEQKSQERIQLDAELVNLGYDPKDSEFANVGTKKLRKIVKEKRMTKVVKDKMKETQESEDSVLEETFRDNIVERLKKLEDENELMTRNIKTMMTAFNDLVVELKTLKDEVKKLEEQSSGGSVIGTDVIRQALEEFKKKELNEETDIDR
jgi:predicted nuclease with TOPRIM domain